MKIKQLLFILLSGVVLAGVGGMTPTTAQDSGWRIAKFDAVYDISQDSSMQVTETISVNFNDLEKHGIYRYILLNYNDDYGQSYKLKYKLISVTDGEGNAIPYSLTGGSTPEVKIGDADVTVSGEQEYVIKYEIKRGIRFLDTDELYWNVTGNGWDVPISIVTAKVNYPSSASNLVGQCYTGMAGSVVSNCTMENTGSSISYYAENLGANEGLTIVAGAPSGTITQPTKWQLILETAVDNLPYIALPFFLLGLLIIWFKKGRDPKDKTTIVPEFEPPDGIHPSLLGVLKDEDADMLDISVGIISLASRGFITIEEIQKKSFLGKTDYRFIKTNKSKNKPTVFEGKLIQEIFGSSEDKKLSDLKNEFYKSIPELKGQLYKDLVEKKYFAKNPSSVRITSIIVGFLLAGGIFGLLGLITDAMTAAIVSTIAAAPFIIWCGFAMPRRTREGAEMLRRVRGFRLFIDTAERYRERFNEQKNIFSEYLPYAIVFGLTKKWAQAFKGLDVTQPSWYHGYSPFDPILFASSMTNATSQFGSVMSSAPSSSGSSGFGGGGFSGGGFGGGGGGSW